MYRVIGVGSRERLEEVLNSEEKRGWTLHSFTAHRSVRHDWEMNYTAVLQKKEKEK